MKNSDSFSFTITVMKYTGVWMPENMTHRQRMAYIAFRCLTQGVMFFFIILAEIGYVFRYRHDTKRLVDAAVLLLSHLVQVAKAVTIIIRQERIKRLIVFGDGPDFTHNDPHLQAIVERAVNVTALVCKGAVFSAFFTSVFWFVVPALRDNLTLPLRTAYPFDISGPYMFVRKCEREGKLRLQFSVARLDPKALYSFAAMYAYSSLSLTTTGIGDAAENFLVSGVLTLASTQVGLLSVMLSDTRNGDKDERYKKVVLCVKFHQRIIEYVDELANIFGLPIFCQCITTSIVVCMTVFKITTTREPIELITVTFYLLCIFMELLMYCYPADVLLNKSLQVAEAAFQDWTGDIRTAKALLLTAMRGQRPLVVNAGSMFKISLPTAAAVVQTSYTYYALLQQKIEQ